MPYVQVYNMAHGLTFQVEVPTEIAAQAEADDCTVTEYLDWKLPVVTYEEFKKGIVPEPLP